MDYRMAHALVRPEFAPLNVKRVHCLWNEGKLGRLKRYCKKRTGSLVPLAALSADKPKTPRLLCGIGWNR